MRPIEHQAFVQRSASFDGYTLYLSRPTFRRGWHEALLSNGEWAEIQDGMIPPAELGIRLPGDAWAAICAEVAPRPDLTYLKEALEVERRRMDNVLGRLLP